MRHLLAIICLSVALPGIASADERASDYEIGVFGGAHRIPSNHELFEETSMQLNEFNPTLGLRFAYLPSDYLAIEGEVAWIFSAADLTDQTVGILSPRAHLRLQLPYVVTPFVLAGGGALMAFSEPTAVGDDIDPGAYWGAGFRHSFTDLADFRVEGRQWFAPAADPDDISTRYEVLVGFDFHLFGNKDSDGDGVYDDADACPAVAGPESNGCPTPDSDGDGLNDREDECPKVAGLDAFKGCPDPDPDKDGVPADKDKCPDVAGEAQFDGCPNPDRDGDGVPNESDACPDLSGEEANGCPATDKDGDGVKDEDDECPEQAGDMANGCPNLDKDEDGVPIPADQCPEEKETVNGYQDGDGCPDEVPEAVKTFTGKIEGINFATGSSRLTPDSLPILDRAVDVLKEFPDLRLRISGHTDSTGSAAGNERISQARADSVVAYMVSKGIAAERLEGKGFGEAKPIADNGTSQGRAANRRIEFELIQ
ncbi:MAG: OmpA family protein [Myxococcota bacterium]